MKLIRQQVEPGEAHEQLVRRFEREAQVTARLRSPHTVQLYDFGVNDTGTFYYVMELLQGLDLQDIVNRFGPQVSERVIALLQQACRSLAEAHEHGLVHRDIKPANLFVARLGNEYDYVKVLDFGIVKDQPGSEGHDTQGSTLLSAPNVLKGTPAFMSPEVILGQDPIDGRADLYSLACAAYWALTGRLVFQANTPTQMLLHHVQTRPATALRSIRASMSTGLGVGADAVSRKRSSEAAFLSARARDDAQSHPLSGALDARSGPGPGGRRTRRKSSDRSPAHEVSQVRGWSVLSTSPFQRSLPGASRPASIVMTASARFTASSRWWVT